jgi:hypothetical protein
MPDTKPEEITGVKNSIELVAKYKTKTVQAVNPAIIILPDNNFFLKRVEYAHNRNEQTIFATNITGLVLIPTYPLIAKPANVITK